MIISTKLTRVFAPILLAGCWWVTSASATDVYRLAVAPAVYKLVEDRAESVSLMLTDGSGFVIYGKVEGKPEQLTCKRSAAFRFAAYANELGTITVGRCKTPSEVDPVTIPEMEERFTKVLERLQVSTEEAAKFAGSYQRFSLHNKAELHVFPVLLVGHGVLVVQTAVGIQKDRPEAVIVQYQAMELCSRLPELPLCTAPEQAIRDLIAELPE